MKIGLVSKEFKNKDIEHNLLQIEDAAKKLSNKVELVCFGESFLQGFNALSWDYHKDQYIAVSSGSTVIKKICQIAINNNLAIAFGYFELDDDAIYCSYMVIDAQGEILENYRRVSKGWKDTKKAGSHYKEGEEFSTFDFNGRKILIAICGDLWYKRNLDQINKIHKDFILWPNHIDYSRQRWLVEENEYLKQTKKLNSPILMINNISLTGNGGAYYFKDGKIMDLLPMGKQGYLIVSIH